ncbi:MAG: hypothetical protein QM652_06160 [Legionella sp.]|uniref:hypothetical protein n=1 Tax=Legionella sp. TaxID=459 RepID=UPI0039E70EB2
MQTKIDEILQQWQNIKEKLKANRLFGHLKDDINLVNKVMQQIKLSNIMTIAELENALTVIENVHVKSSKYNPEPLGVLLDKPQFGVF